MSDSRRYSTRNDAIQREIIEPLEASGERQHDYDLVSGVVAPHDYDIAAIADEVLGGYEDGFARLVTDDEFWASVARHAYGDYTLHEGFATATAIGYSMPSNADAELDGLDQPIVPRSGAIAWVEDWDHALGEYRGEEYEEALDLVPAVRVNPGAEELHAWRVWRADVESSEPAVLLRWIVRASE